MTQTWLLPSWPSPDLRPTWTWAWQKYKIRWSPYSYQNNKEKYEVRKIHFIFIEIICLRLIFFLSKDDKEKRIFNLKVAFWFCVTTLTPQGGGEVPKNLSGRFVSATWWLFGFVFVATYTANMGANLTVLRIKGWTLKSLDDLLAENSGYQWVLTTLYWTRTSRPSS